MLAIELEVVTLQNKCKEFDQGFLLVGLCWSVFPRLLRKLGNHLGVICWCKAKLHPWRPGVCLGQRTKGILFPKKICGIL